MHFDGTITLGNVLEILGVVGGGIWFAIRILAQSIIFNMRLTNIETTQKSVNERLERIERQNVLPIPERSRLR